MKNRLFTTANMTMLAILSALSYVLYFFIKFPMPYLFPAFLDFQFSDIPILLGGFIMGPLGGIVIVAIRFAIKVPFTTTGGVGEFADVLISLAMVVPASIIYRYNKTRKGAIIAMLVGGACSTTMAILANWLIIVPFYVEVMFKGNWNILIGAVRSLFPAITRESFFQYYLFLSVLPFNVIRITVCSILTYFLYKRLSVIFKKLHKNTPKDS